jgi:hypothetical protein
MKKNRRKNGDSVAAKKPAESSVGEGAVKKSISMPGAILAAAEEKAGKHGRTLSGYLQFLAARDCGLLDESVTA